LTYIGDVLAKFEILVAMVYAVAGLLLVVGGVQEEMRQVDIGVKLYLLLHVAVAIRN
jgi:hypothetical protein